MAAAGNYGDRRPFWPEVGHLEGMARWSGTSFSTPLVAGQIAGRMSSRAETGRRAAEALPARARAGRLPAVAPVPLPCLDDD